LCAFTEGSLVPAVVVTVLVVIAETIAIVICGFLLFRCWRIRVKNNFSRGNENSWNTTINRSYAAVLDTSDTINSPAIESVANMNSKENEMDG